MQEKYELQYLESESSVLTEQEEEISLDMDNENNKKNYETPSKKQFITRNVQIAHMKHLPTYFFICFLIIFSLLLFKFIPCVYIVSSTHVKYSSLIERKFTFTYFSQFIGDLDVFSKIIFFFSQAILMMIIFSLSSRRKSNECSSAEIFAEEKISNLLVSVLFGLSLVFSFMVIELYQWTRNLSLKIGLVDNAFFMCYMLSSFLLNVKCYWKFITGDGENRKGACIKGYMIVLMRIELCLYGLSVFLVSYYSPVSDYEKFAIFLLLIGINTNCVMYLLTSSFFILSLKNEFQEEGITLQLKCKNEYYVDLDESYKNAF